MNFSPKHSFPTFHFYKEILFNSTVGIAVCDFSGQCLEVNDAMCQMVGGTKEQILALNFNSMNSWKQSGLLDVTLAVIKEKTKKNHDITITTSFGKTLAIDCHIIPFFVERQNYLLFIFNDITRRKQAEITLQDSLRELSIRNRIVETFLTISDDKMYEEVLNIVLEAMNSKFGTFAYLNEDGDRIVPSMTGEVWEQCKMPDKDIIFPRKEWGDVLWAKCIREKMSFSSNGPFKVPEGHVAIKRALAVPIIHKNEVIGNLMVGDKATDYDKRDKELLETIANHVAPILYARLQDEKYKKYRNQAEKRLKLKEMLLNRSQEIAHIGSWHLDLGKNILTWSAEECRIFGKDPDDYIQSYESFIDAVHPEDRAMVDKTYTDAIKNKYPYECIHRVMDKDGNIRIVLEKSEDIVSESGEVVQSFGFTQDITKQKQQEKEREGIINNLTKSLEEIKILRGILPICSYCKKIRNDEGYYEQIENYIHKHSGVDFSHTICPNCMKKHYPEDYEALVQEIKNNN